MYGMVNKAVERLISEKFGPERWEQIKKAVPEAAEPFVSLNAYPDSVTFALVAGACKELDMSAADVLFALGKFWIEFARREGYGQLLDLAGDNVEEVMIHLDELHTRVALTFPDLKMPRFAVRNSKEGYFRLHYHSERRGLAQFVCGLVAGVGDIFDTKVRCDHVISVEDGADFDEFDVWQGMHID